MNRAYLIKESTLVDIANAIREKTGSSEKIGPTEMDDIIRNLSSTPNEDENENWEPPKDWYCYYWGEEHEEGIIAYDPEQSSHIYAPQGIVAYDGYHSNGIMDSNGSYCACGMIDEYDYEHHFTGILSEPARVEYHPYGIIDKEQHFHETGMITSDGTIHSKGLIDKNGAYHTQGMIDANGVFHNSGKLDAWGGWTSN